MILPHRIVVYLVDGPPAWAPRLRNLRARNRSRPRLTFRPLGDSGRYPEWLRELKERSGVYVIRERGEVVYVGESHSDRLYGTITRHFQKWDRRKRARRFGGDYRRPTDNDPGTRYDRDACEVAIILTPADGRAIEKQNHLIGTLSPRDNVQGQLPIAEDLEDVPF